MLRYILFFSFISSTLLAQELKYSNDSFTQEYSQLVQARLTQDLTINALSLAPNTFEDVNLIKAHVEKLLGEAIKLEVEKDQILGSSEIHMSYPEFLITFSNHSFGRMTLSSIYWNEGVHRFFQLNPTYQLNDLILMKGAIPEESCYVYSSVDGVKTSYNPYFIFRFENEKVVSISWLNPNT